MSALLLVLMIVLALVLFLPFRLWLTTLGRAAMLGCSAAIVVILLAQLFS
jgi:hypothetical protein